MQAISEVLGKNYMYVLGKTWVINTTLFQQTCWKVFEMFIDKETAAKITFTRSPHPRDLVDGFHPNQLEKRFGGQADLPTQYWPPIIPYLDYS